MEPENIIKSIPEEGNWEEDCGDVRIRFMRLTPSFKTIDKVVPLSQFLGKLPELKKEIKESGIILSLDSSNLKVKDYFNFTKSLLKNQRVEIIDNQNERDAGMPDFEVKVEEGRNFHIEFKSKKDSVRPTQLQWIGNNQDQEVWFLILEDLEFYLKSEELEAIKSSAHIENIRAADRISESILEEFNNKLQNQQTKITQDTSKNNKNGQEK